MTRPSGLKRERLGRSRPGEVLGALSRLLPCRRPQVALDGSWLGGTIMRNLGIVALAAALLGRALGTISLGPPP